MSKETLEHLNTNVLIGNTDHRGHAWHYREDLQAHEPNHYPGPIPVDDVRRRLFNWEAVSRPVAVEVPADVATFSHFSNGDVPSRWQPITDRQAITRSDTDAVMGIFSTGYQPHQYNEWLLTTVSNILDDSLSISSAGLLKGGAIAWVEISVPESIQTPEGVEFRPNLLATTSFDGSTATTWKRTCTLTICDNTRELALAEKGQDYRVKHTRNSQARLSDARDALHIVHGLEEAFAAEVAELCAIDVLPREWHKFLDQWVPRTDERGMPLAGRALTMADKKWDELQHLFVYDHRVGPWAGTAYGVIQCVNTYEHHVANVRGATRADRNQLRTISGDFAKSDKAALAVLEKVLAA